MTIDLYCIPRSPVSRSVLMLAKYIGVHINIRFMNVQGGDTLQPWFKKVNPAHLVPTMDDHGIILWESRVIMTYLIMKYAKNDALYPKDPEKRGMIDYRLFFDLGTLYNNIFAYGSPVLFGQRDFPDDKLYAPMIRGIELFNGFLENSTFAAGEELSVADFCMLGSISLAKSFQVDITPYEHIVAWYERCRVAMDKCGFEEYNEFYTRDVAAGYLANLKV